MTFSKTIRVTNTWPRRNRRWTSRATTKNDTIGQAHHRCKEPRTCSRSRTFNFNLEQTLNMGSQSFRRRRGQGHVQPLQDHAQDRQVSSATLFGMMPVPARRSSSVAPWLPQVRRRQNVSGKSSIFVSTSSSWRSRRWRWAHGDESPDRGRSTFEYGGLQITLHAVQSAERRHGPPRTRSADGTASRTSPTCSLRRSAADQLDQPCPTCSKAPI